MKFCDKYMRKSKLVVGQKIKLQVEMKPWYGCEQ